MNVHLVDGLPAVLVLIRYRDGHVTILANPAEPWRYTYGLSRILCWPHERRELLRALLAN